jgi:hypothetical protein
VTVWAFGFGQVREMLSTRRRNPSVARSQA